MTETLLPEPPTPREVLILGAGFSRNLSKHFPCTDQLGEQAALAAGIGVELLPTGGFKDGNFETWLSHLAEDQPYLSDMENFRNRARFMEVSRAIVETLRSRELEAFKKEADFWLYKLLSVVHYRQATIITLNFDTVIEVGLETHQLMPVYHPLETGSFPLSGGSRLKIGADDVLSNFPPRIRGSLPARGIGMDGVAVPIAQSFRLLKLHGSLDWFWASGDLTGETLRRATVTSQFGHPLDDPDLRRQEVEGLDPFIVPPTAIKSLYYSNLRTRWLWRKASDALRSASRISLLGYSLPPADLVMSGMLEEVARRPSVELEVVDRKSDVPKKRLETLGAGHVEETSGEQCMEHFVDKYCDRAAAELIHALRSSLSDDVTVGVFWGDGDSFRPVIGLERREAELRLSLQEDGLMHWSASAVKLSDLVATLDGVTRMVVSLTNGIVTPIVAAVLSATGGALPPIKSLSLLPAGKRDPS